MSAPLVYAADLAREIAESAFAEAAEIYFVSIVDEPQVTPEMIEALTDHVVNSASSRVSRALIGRGCTADCARPQSMTA